MQKLFNRNDIIPPGTEGRLEMTTNIDCPTCTPKDGRHHFLYNCAGNFLLCGTIKCLVCNDERSFSAKGEYIREIGLGLTYAESKRLTSNVFADRKDDIEEAERANYYQCYKAAVVMCRRAIQLALNDKDIPDSNFSNMIEKAHDEQFKLLGDDTYMMVKLVKLFGDKGAHKRDTIAPPDVTQAIHVSVEALNDIFNPK